MDFGKFMGITLGAIALPEDLIWSDEFNWSPMAKSVAYAVDGALHVHNAVKLKGRPITLAGDASSAWIARGLVDDLYALLSSAAAMTLTLNDARTFSVTFAPDGAPIAALPIVDYSTPDDADWYSLTVKLLEI